VRYDPLSGRKVSVTQDDARYLEWPTSKPSLQTRKINQLIDDPVKVASTEAVKVASRSATRLSRKIVPAVTAIAARYGMSAAGLAARASLVGAAGFAAHWLTTKLRTVRWATWDDLQYDLANRVRHARQAAAAEYGRPLTPEEIKGIDTWYRAAKARLLAQQAAGATISTFRFGD